MSLQTEYENTPTTEPDNGLFRYTFSKELTVKLHEFATNHKDTKMKIFKTEWEKWIKEEPIANLINAQIDDYKARSKAKISVQTKTLENEIMDKMIKSARYYHRKKTEKTKKTERKVYSRQSKMLLKKIDDHISNLHNQKNISPAKAFEMFLQTEPETTKPDDIINLKKTYKNRFYVFVKKST
jgi:hypothetical protein